MTRYFIEQAKDRFYQESELATAKARCRTLSKKLDGGVYLIAEEYDADTRDYQPCGSIAFYGGYADAMEGCFA